MNEETLIAIKLQMMDLAQQLAIERRHSVSVLCPHHEEKTPSCMVYPNGYYHCMGCGVIGKVPA